MLDTLITKSIQENESKYLEKLPRVGLTKTENDLVDWLLEYSKKHKSLPSKDRFEDSDYAHYWNERRTSDPFTDVYEETLFHLKKIYFNSKMQEMIETFETGGDITGGDLHGLAKSLGVFTDIEVNDIFTVDRSGLYSHELPENVVQFGWLDIDLATSGIFPGEVCLLVARPGTGKSLFSFYLAIKWAREGKRVLVISSEMAIRQMASRFDGMLANFNPSIHRMKDDFSKLDEYQKLVNVELETIKTTGGNVIFPHQGTITVNGIRGLLNEHEPDVLIVDGVYMVEHGGNFENGWQKEAAVFSELKQIALDYDIPTFSTTQIGRSGDIAGTDKYNQVADVIIKAWPFAEEMKSDIEMRIEKNRNGSSQGQVTLQVDWNESKIKEKIVMMGKKK